MNDNMNTLIWEPNIVITFLSWWRVDLDPKSAHFWQKSSTSRRYISKLRRSLTKNLVCRTIYMIRRIHLTKKINYIRTSTRYIGGISIFRGQKLSQRLVLSYIYSYMNSNILKPGSVKTKQDFRIYTVYIRG